jgi:hypothetical protein
MKIKMMLGAAIAIAAIQSQSASAQSFVLDTGTPPSSGTSSVSLNSADWYAAEFTVGPGETLTELSAYLTQGAGQVGNTFTWDLYSASGVFLGANRELPTDSTTGTFNANGWNSTSIDWGVGAGTYWIALQVSSSSQTPGLDLVTETSTTTGTAPAQAFAYAGTTGRYATETANPFGVQVSAVPLPAASWLLGSALAGLGFAVRGRRRSLG